MSIRRLFPLLLLGAGLAVVVADRATAPTRAQPAAAVAPPPGPERIAGLALRRADPYTLDLVKHAGVLPGQEHAARNRAAIQNAINALHPTLMPGRRGGELWGRIVVPNWTVWVDGPLWWDQGRTEIIGAGPNAAIRLAHGHEDAVLVLGASRRPQGRELAEADFPANPLDPTRRAVRTGKAHHLAGMASPLAFGPDRWAAAQQVTIDFALDTRATPLSSGPVCGAQEGNTPAPMIVRTDRVAPDDGRVTVQFQLRGGGVSQYQFAVPAGPGVLQVRFQLDLARREARAWADGRECREFEETWRTAAEPGADRFEPHQHAPFLVGAAGDKALSHGSSPLGADPDHELTLAGLHLAVGLRGPPAEAPPSYFAPDARTIALLPFDQPAAQCAFWRTVPVQAGPSLGGRRSSLLVFDPFHAGPFSSISDYRLIGVRLGPYDPSLNLGARHGQTVAMAHALFVLLKDSTIEGGAQAVGCLGSSANYTVSIEGCTLSGHDAALFAWYCQWKGQDLHVPFCGRGGFLRNHLGQVRLRDVFVGPYGEPEVLVRSSGGATTRLQDVNIDREAGDHPTVAAFWSQASLAPTTGGLDLERVAIGHVPPGVPLVRLVDESPASPESPTLRVDRLSHENGARTMVDRLAPRWVVRGVDPVDAP